MKPYRTTLRDDAAAGSVRAALHDANAPRPDHARYKERLSETSPSAVLRERLTQTRARIERAHATKPPQIDVDWDPEEPPTRIYQGETLVPRARPRREEHPLTAYAFAQFRARVTQRPPASVQPPASAALSVSQRATQLLPEAPRIAEPEPHIPALQEQHQTSPPFARRVLKEATLMGERLGKLYERLDRSDAALRRRVVYCSVALLVIAAGSRMLFGAHSDVGSAPPPPSTQTAAPQRANIAISSDPPGAQIFLNGEASSHVTPTELTDLAPGRHLIGLKLAGYADAKEVLHVPGDALVSIKLASLDEPRFAPELPEARTPLTRAEQRAQARERRAAARAAKVLLRYRARMGLPPDPVAQELVEAYGPTQSAE